MKYGTSPPRFFSDRARVSIAVPCPGTTIAPIVTGLGMVGGTTPSHSSTLGNIQLTFWKKQRGSRVLSISTNWKLQSVGAIFLRKERMDGYQWTCPVHVQRSYSLFCLFLLLVETCSFRSHGIFPYLSCRASRSSIHGSANRRVGQGHA